jgi:hypothetical protein
VPQERGGRHRQRWRFGVRLLRRGAGRWTIPEDYLRSRPRPLLQIRAPGGPGRGTRAGRRRRRSAGTRWEPAWAVRTRPRSGAGSGGGGKRTPCVCECKGSDTSHQLQTHFGDHVWRPWKTFYLQPASNAGRFISRCSSASLHLAAGPLRGHRPVEAPSALHHLVCRVSFDTWRHAGAPLSSSFKESNWGLGFGVPR